MKKTIIAQLSIQSAKTKEFLELADNMIQKSIAESGCLTYKLLKEFDKENEFFFYEKYESDKAVENHNSSEHFKNFINFLTPLLAKEPTIETF